MISATVGSEDFERQLEVVRAFAPGKMEGVFGPDSLTWRIDREALTFLGAGRALLLQLAHPWVAAAIAEHSKTVDDPDALRPGGIAAMNKLHPKSARRLHDYAQQGDLSEDTGIRSVGRVRGQAYQEPRRHRSRG
jgi:mpaB/rubber oxygenase-like protein